MIHIQTVKKHLSSSLLVFAGLAFVISFFFILFPIPNKTYTQKIVIKGHSNKQTPQHAQNIQTVQTQTMPSQMPTSYPTAFPIAQSQTIPTAIPPTQQPQPQTVTLTITEPNVTTSQTIIFSNGENPCSILYDAKNQGKIHSVTIKTYGPPLNSDYVQEMNGYQNNWTFTLNGVAEPTGCSNYRIKNGDRITWKFG